MIRRIILFLWLLLGAFFVYRRYNQTDADALLYKIRTLSFNTWSISEYTTLVDGKAIKDTQETEIKIWTGSEESTSKATTEETTTNQKETQVSTTNTIPATSDTISDANWTTPTSPDEAEIISLLSQALTRNILILAQTPPSLPSTNVAETQTNNKILQDALSLETTTSSESNTESTSNKTWETTQTTSIAQTNTHIVTLPSTPAQTNILDNTKDQKLQALEQEISKLRADISELKKLKDNNQTTSNTTTVNPTSIQKTSWLSQRDQQEASEFMWLFQ